MVYTQRTAWTLVLGVIMVAYAYLVESGALEPAVKYLATARLGGEMRTLGYTFAPSPSWPACGSSSDATARVTSIITSPPSPA